MRRFELLTPCLQGRCSPNWATPPLYASLNSQLLRCYSFVFSVMYDIHSLNTHFVRLALDYLSRLKGLCVFMFRLKAYVFQCFVNSRLPHCYSFVFSVMYDIHSLNTHFVRLALDYLSRLKFYASLNKQLLRCCLFVFRLCIIYTPSPLTAHALY